MESHLVRIINRLEAMTIKDEFGNLKRNFEREGVVAEVAYNLTTTKKTDHSSPS